ncbi:uroporphyrinogen-III C-methyltransferase [Nitriliruptoraceae bacterium ZYF776]|nr:uroporphyrinogen-III C-methyltransferase [Profundirhabdus halotolerans]
MGGPLGASPRGPRRVGGPGRPRTPRRGPRPRDHRAAHPDRGGCHVIGTLALSPARRGTVHLVGAGPGDPGLLTLRAARLLGTADVVAHDRLVDPAVLALVPATTELLAVGKPGPGCGGWRQEDITQRLIAEAQAGRAVVRLKGGDPFVFGRGGEEAIACHEAGVDVEVVPGVTSAVAAPAAAGIPVTHRGLASAVAFVTGHEDPAKPSSQLEWGALAAFPGTLVFLMGLHHVDRIAEQLVLHGRDAATPVAVVRWGTTDRQEELVTDLASLGADVARAGIASPATIVVGDVVAVRDAVRGRVPLHLGVPAPAV